MDPRPFLRSADEVEKLADIMIAARVNEVESVNSERRMKNLAIELGNAIAKAFGGR